MEGPLNGRSIDHMLNFIHEGSKPYEGETVEPVTMLDAAVLDAITKFGNENIPPPTDAYESGLHESSVKPSDYTEDPHSHKLTFGIDYLTHTFSLPDSIVICTYHKGSGHARTIIDDLKEGSGLVTRTTFSSSPEAPDTITKQRRTYQPYKLRMDIPDFHRTLKKREVTELLGLLDDPSEHIELAGVLSTVNSKEARMTERNRAKRKEQYEQLRKNFESIQKARDDAYRHGNEVILN